MWDTCIHTYVHLSLYICTCIHFAELIQVCVFSGTVDFDQAVTSESGPEGDPVFWGFSRHAPKP